MSDTEENLQPQNKTEPEILCQKCGQPNSPHAGWCLKCSTPLPVRDDSAEPASAAAQQSSRTIVPVRGSAMGMLALWFIITPVVALLAVLCFEFASHGGGPAAAYAWLGLIAVGLYAIALALITRRYFRVRRLPVTSCTKCEYQVRGVPPKACPECGYPFPRAALRDAATPADDDEPVQPFWVKSDSVYSATVGLCLAWTVLWTWYGNAARSAGARLAPAAVCASTVASFVLFFGGLQRIADKSRPRCSTLFWCAFILNAATVAVCAITSYATAK